MAISAKKNTIYYLIGSIIKAFTSFILLPIYSNALGSAQYGVLNLLQTFSIVLVAFMTLSTERSIYRLFHDYNSNFGQTTFLSTVFWGILVIGITCIVFFVLIGDFVTPYIGGVDICRTFYPVLFYSFINAVFSFCQTIQQVTQQAKVYFVNSIISLVVINVFSLCFLFYYEKSYQSIIYADLIGVPIYAVYGFLSIREFISFKFSFKIFRKVFKFCFPVFIMVVFAWLLSVSDRIFISEYTNYESVGVYSLASKITSVITLFAGAIYQAYNPYFFKIANSVPIEEARNKLLPINNTISFIIVVLALLLSIFTKPILFLFFSSDYYESYLYVYILSISMIFLKQSGILNVMIYQNKKTIGLSVITIVGGIISVVLNNIFIPKFGAISSAYVNLLVGVWIFFMTFFLSKRNYYLGFNFSNVLLPVLLAICCCFVDMEVLSIWIALVIKLIFVSFFIIVFTKLGHLQYPVLYSMFNRFIVKYK